jgi:hypothetical protein
MTRLAGPRSRASVTLLLASLVLLPALTLAACASSSPSPSHVATASSVGDGVYLVGTDIPAGIYKGTTASDTLGLWQISSDANGSSIIANNLTTSGQFYVQVKQGQYLKLRGVEIVKAAAAPTKMRSSVGDGVYLVGADIPAGRYRAEVMFGGANWQISRDANGTLVVHSADGLSVSVRSPRRSHFYIQVKRGQYLELYSVKARRVK